ncbi:MAG: hypothetical protein CMJ83_01425 [Planctomycetes bacterium]|nr:hypothetical protein [Planctomycetota bacterium]
MFKRTDTGAVHILFLIFVLVVALAFGALWFLELQANEDAVADKDAAEYALDEMTDKFFFQKDYWEKLAPFMGAGIPPNAPVPTEGMNVNDAVAPLIATLEGDLGNIGNRIDDPAARPTNLRDAWDPIINRYQVLKGEIAALKTQIGTHKADVASRDAQIASDTADHAKAVQDLQTDHEGTLSTKDQQINQMRTQNEEFQTTIRDQQAAAEKERETFNEEKKTIADDKEDLEGRVRQIHSEARIKRATNEPDGEVLSYDPVTGKVFINIGSDDMLRRGTRFRVLEVIKGTRHHKGWITVTNTMNGMSEAHLDEGVAPDARDILMNPVFDKNETVRFVFLGTLPGKYNRETAERILGKLGAKVEGNVTIRTDFLVLGMKESEDDDEITEREDYKNAQRWGIEMIRARDLQPFLQL